MESIFTKVMKEKSYKGKQDRIQLAKHYTPWTSKWMHLMFHYTSSIQDDTHLTHDERIQNFDLSQRLKSFVEQRKNFRYELIAPNARDLGGYYTKSGHQVKTGLLIRSSNLHNLDFFGLRVLQRLHLSDVIDLREHHLNTTMRDNINPKLVHNIPVYTKKGVNQSRNKTFQYGVIYRYGSLFLTNPHAQQAYRKSFQIFKRSEGATVFHCTEGRDRTGVLAILLLTALGVDKQTIINDYLLTDVYAPTKPYIKMLDQVNYFYDKAHELYGNVWDYMLHIGITLSDIKALRNKYLN